MEYILGIAASLLTQGIKRYFSGEWTRMAVVVAISFIVAALYVNLSGTEIWPTLMQVIVSAGAFHTFIIRRF